MSARSPRDARRSLRLVISQPVLSFMARRNARARELAAAMQLPCSVCGAALSTHVGPGNRWVGCRKDGER